MHFEIDQEPTPAVAKVAIPEKPAEDPRAVQEAKLASEMLFASTPVRLAGEVKNHDRVEVILKDIYREGDRLYVRYAIQNRGRSTYVPGTPGVFTLRIAPQFQFALRPFPKPTRRRWNSPYTSRAGSRQGIERGSTRKGGRAG